MTPSPWEHFSLEELGCHCGCGKMFMNADFMAKAVKIRKFYGRPMIITSGYRCPAHDEKIGTSTKPGAGPHTMGRALDVNVWGKDLVDLLEAVGKLDLITGIGLSQKHSDPASARFVHVDDIDIGESSDHVRPAIWTY